MSHVSTYDEVEFPSYPYPQTHPARLATIAKLCGLAPPTLDRCSVLELGCGTGGNLLPLAESLPESRLAGIDLSPQQISIAQERFHTAGLNRVQLEARDILDFDPSWGPFDFIIAHGLFSWTTDAVRGKILDVIAESLTEHGIAYVNFNTYPGWHVQGMLRDMVAYPGRQLSDAQEKVQEARRIIDFFQAALPPATNPWGALLRHELDSIRRHSDPFLFHAYLNVVNRPFYFHEFQQQAAERGLQVFGDADPQMSWPALAEPQLLGPLKQYQDDPAQWPQLYDFARLSTSRRSLLCRQLRSSQREVSAQLLDGLFAAARLEKRNAGSSGVAFVSPAGKKVQTSQPRLIRALEILADAWPESRSLQELQGDEQIGNSPAAAIDAWKLELLRCFCHDVLDLSVWRPLVRNQISDKPRTTNFALVQTQGSDFVTNLRHQVVRLSSVEMRCLSLCDGSRTVAQITAELGSDAQSILQKLNAESLLIA